LLSPIPASAGLPLLDYDAYVGPAPVSLEDYWEQVARQSIKLAQVTAANMGRVFVGLVVYPDLLEQLGPAAVSGKPLFLYDPPETGKPPSPPASARSGTTSFWCLSPCMWKETLSGCMTK
jgi:hypothetical protein